MSVKGESEYGTYKEVGLRAYQLGIKSSTQYRKKYTKLAFFGVNAPAHPEEVYKGEWDTWKAFLLQHIPSYTELSRMVQDANLTTKSEYLTKKDSIAEMLYAPNNPDEVYFDEWEGWTIFFGQIPLHVPEPINWASFAEVKKAALAANVTSSGDYQKKYKNFPCKAPSHPSSKYHQWTSWYDFLNNGTKQLSKYHPDQRRPRQKKGKIKHLYDDIKPKKHLPKWDTLIRESEPVLINMGYSKVIGKPTLPEGTRVEIPYLYKTGFIINFAERVDWNSTDVQYYKVV